MEGKDGDDTYVVQNSGDQVIEASGAGTGTDLVESSVSFSLAGQYIENLTLTGGNINGTGNTLTNTIMGSTGKNIITGGGRADQLYAGADDVEDRFVFRSLDDSGYRAGQFDRISVRREDYIRRDDLG